MRELKFRAWDKKRQKWLKPDSKEVLAVTFDGSVINCYDDSCESPILYLEDTELTQCTGKIDKNGKDIYEGDLVQVEAGLSGASSSECKQMIGKVVYDEKGFSGFTVNLWHDGSWWAYGYLKWQTAEVIGNIYEHPELLKQKAPNQ